MKVDIVARQQSQWLFKFKYTGYMYLNTVMLLPWFKSILILNWFNFTLHVFVFSHICRYYKTLNNVTDTYFNIGFIGFMVFAKSGVELNCLWIAKTAKVYTLENIYIYIEVIWYSHTWNVTKCCACCILHGKFQVLASFVSKSQKTFSTLP